MSLSNAAGPAAPALAEPERRVRPVWTAGVVLVNVGINAAFFGPLQVLLGQQAAAFSEPDKEAILALVTGAILAAASPGIAARGGATLASVVGAYLLLVALLVACILVPAVVLGRGRESFRRRIRTDARLRAAVEADLANWQDPHGTAGFGPL